MLNNKTENVIKLAVIAALTDGETNSHELATAVGEVADQFGEDVAAVIDYALEVVYQYTHQGLQQDKGLAAITAIEALQALGLRDDATDARAALAIARDVVQTDDQESSEEHDFLGLLSQILGIQSN